MEPRARRFAIRQHLNDARAALERGDRVAALSAVDAALALDPDFLAAQALRERVLREPVTGPAAQIVKPDAAASTPPPEERPAPPSASPPGQWPPPASSERLRRPALPQEIPQQGPLVSAEGWARFEYRTRVRRIEKRAEAARAAIARRRFAQAREVLDEIREIDAAHPDLISLGIELDAAEHLARGRSSHWGPALAAMLVFGGLLLGARYLESPHGQPTAPSASVTTPVSKTAEAQPATAAPAEPSAAARVERTVAPLPTATTMVAPAPEAAVPPSAPVNADVETPADVRSAPADDEPVERSRPEPRTPIVWPPRELGVTPAPAASPVAATPAPPAPTTAPAATAAALASAAPTPPTPSAPVLTPAVSPVVLPGAVPPARYDPPPSRIGDRQPAAVEARVSVPSAAVVGPRDEDLVRRTLQQYRSAYDNLDARSAVAVWPRVDGVALQRAFDGLQSQRLTFDDCQVQVRGATGTAICRGSARYVPKVGSREPRVEPRVWTFGLRKNGDEWQIDTARAER